MNFFISYTIFSATLITVVVLDQLTKFLAYTHLRPVIYKPLLPFLYLTYTENTGAAWGILQGHNWLFILFTILAIVLLTIEVRKQSIIKNGYIVFGLITGGATGNLIDRIFRGKVIDFIDFRFFPVFNIADTSISIGLCLLLLLYYLRDTKKVQLNTEH